MPLKSLEADDLQLVQLGSHDEGRLTLGVLGSRAFPDSFLGDPGSLAKGVEHLKGLAFIVRSCSRVGSLYMKIRLVG